MELQGGVIFSCVVFFFLPFKCTELQKQGFLAYFKEDMSKVPLWIFIFKKYPFLRSYNTKSEKTQGGWKEEAMDKL